VVPVHPAQRRLLRQQVVPRLAANNEPGPGTDFASRLAALPGGLISLSAVAGASVFAIYLLVVRTYWGQRLDEHAFVGHNFFTSGAAQAHSFLRIVSVGSLVLAVVLIAAVAIMRRRPRLALIAAASIGISVLSTELLKLIVLERPTLAPSYIFDNSYPSGHTTVGMSVAVAVMLVVPRRLLIPTALGAGALGAAFGVAVVAAGWHRPSDAVGAFLLVLCVGAACAAVARVFPDRVPDLDGNCGPRIRRPQIRLGSTEFGLLALALGGLGVFALAALSYRGIPWTSTSAGFLLSAAAIVVLGLLTTIALAVAMLASDDPDEGTG
jgi:membrane-associated phospholipid phosphatase